jgi:hypothetical protein
MLTLRALWQERNARVFDDTSTSVGRVLDGVVEEWHLWLSCRRGQIQEIG